MGLLDSILGGALGGGTAQGGTAREADSGSPGGGALAALLPVVLSMLANRQGGGASGGSGGGLGDMIGGMLGGGSRGGSSGGGLGDLLGGMMGGQSSGGGGLGGLGSLLEQFQQAGLGDQVKSWVGTGQNLPISADAIGQVFGGDTISRIARQAGLSESEASHGLSELLPEVVDKLTPGGELPDFAQLSASVDALRQRIGG